MTSPLASGAASDASQIHDSSARTSGAVRVIGELQARHFVSGVLISQGVATVLAVGLITIPILHAFDAYGVATISLLAMGFPFWNIARHARWLLYGIRDCLINEHDRLVYIRQGGCIICEIAMDEIEAIGIQRREKRGFPSRDYYQIWLRAKRCRICLIRECSAQDVEHIIGVLMRSLPDTRIIDESESATVV